jgi:rubredoxin
MTDYQCMNCGAVYRDRKPTTKFYDIHGEKHIEGLTSCSCSAGHDAIKPIDESTVPREMRAETTHLQKLAGERQGDITTDILEKRKKGELDFEPKEEGEIKEEESLVPVEDTELDLPADSEEGAPLGEKEEPKLVEGPVEPVIDTTEPTTNENISNDQL